MQVEPMKPMLKAPGTKRLKPYTDKPPSNVAFKVHLRRYTKEGKEFRKQKDKVGRCRLTL